MADSVVVLEPGEERAQKIAKAMASQTAGDILRLIGEGPKTSTEISEQLALPMNTAKYHIENLLDAGLVSVASTKYSVKGREVKVYTLTNQLLIVAPRQLNVRSLLLKYASLFGIVAFGSLVIALVSPLLSRSSVIGDGMAGAAPQFAAEAAAGPLQKTAADNIVPNYSGMTEMAVTGTRDIAEMAASNVSAVPAAAPHVAVVSGEHAATTGPVAAAGSFPMEIALAFLLGGSVVILILVCYEIILWNRMKSR